MNKNKIGIVGGGLGGHNAMLDRAMYMASKEINHVVLVDTNNFDKEFQNYLYGSFDDKLISFLDSNPYANSNEPKAIKDYLLENNFNTFSKLESEYKLIQDKKSKQSSQVRTMVVNAYETVTKNKK